VFSYLGKPTGKYAALCLPHVEHKRMALSFISIGELYYGAKKAEWSDERVSVLDDRLRSVLIVPYDKAVCLAYASIEARLEADGKGIDDNDLWIAACAIRHSIPLVSNNRNHFERVPGLVLISETRAMNELKSQMNLIEKEGELTPPSSQSETASEATAPKPAPRRR
jgi:tRNA(fMet)-specific endonuclease VapC